MIEIRNEHRFQDEPMPDEPITSCLGRSLPNPPGIGLPLHRKQSRRLAVYVSRPLILHGCGGVGVAGAKGLPCAGLILETWKVRRTLIVLGIASLTAAGLMTFRISKCLMNLGASFDDSNPHPGPLTPVDENQCRRAAVSFP